LADANHASGYLEKPVERNQKSVWRPLVALFLFGASFGYVEAAVVVYLREHYEPLKRELHQERAPGDLFPLVTLQQLAETGGPYERLLGVEVIREAATIALLISIATAISWNFNAGMAAFLIAFGVWDIFYYVFLKAIIDWPQSIFEWDILFLIPLPWVGPVVAPVLVSVSMIVTGIWLLGRESAGQPVRIGWPHWGAIVAGGLVIIVSFCWDYRQVMAGGMPNPFPWSIFVAGEALGLAGFGRAMTCGRDTGRTRSRPMAS
jgi:hypothetical protein